MHFLKWLFQRRAAGNRDGASASGEDRHVFQEHVLPHLDAMYGLAMSLTRNPADAQDLVQETCLKALKNFDRFEKGTNIKAWLFTILRNSFINQYRRKKRAGEESVDADPKFSFYAEAKSAIDRSQFDATDEDLRNPEKLEFLLGDEISGAIAQLPEEYREVIYLCDVQDLSYKEIASIAGIPIGTVRSRLARARAMLQKLLWNYAKEKGIVKGGASR